MKTLIFFILNLISIYMYSSDTLKIRNYKLESIEIDSFPIQGYTIKKYIFTSSNDTILIKYISPKIIYTLTQSSCEFSDSSLTKYSFDLVKICYLSYKKNRPKVFMDYHLYDLYDFSDNCEIKNINLENKKVLKKCTETFTNTNIIEYEGCLYEIKEFSPCNPQFKW